MRRMKRLPSMTLMAALTASIGGCDADPGQQVQRDVYTGPNAYENCVADWGNEALCQQRLSDEEKKRVATSSGSGANHVFIWGPGYSGAERSVVHNGATYAPTATRATQTAAFNSQYKPTSYSAPRPATSSSVSALRAPTITPTTSVVSRGGFGSSGHGVSAGG